MTNRQIQFRRVHRLIAPVMLLPILLTLVTGSLYQMVDLGGRGGDFDWLLHLHKGDFGIINIGKIYPFLNALGLLVLAVTGISLWLQTRRIPRRPPASS